MCGICGIYGFTDRTLIKQMTTSLVHRGPDASGVFVDNSICLGHRRLSIIDLSMRGKQPMFNEDESVAIVFNGEIYNYKELREQLIACGHKFKSETDTEVIIHGYEEYGLEIASKLNGDFAFAIWDSNIKQLYIARDYAGIKPLYYYIDGKNVLFASEIKSILCYKKVKREVDREALNSFLTFRYVPGEKTLFKGIQKLIPGHYLVVSKEGVKIQKYWDLDLSRTLKKSTVCWAQEIQTSLRDAVDRRLMSDVPLGAFLSGGLDSSFVVGLMKQIGVKDVKTFSVGFENKKFDETKYARLAAENLGTEHHELYIDSSAVKNLPNVIWHLDEPIADAAAVPTYMLSQFARKKVTVALTGEGADELFAGYSKYKLMRWKQYYDHLPLSIRGLLLEKGFSFSTNPLIQRGVDLKDLRIERRVTLN